MQSAQIPADEANRIAALYRYQILDTEKDEFYDELAELAASICDAPIALVSLVDQSRQWFKARVGLEAQQTARSVSFCAHAILQPGLFLVPDTLADERFADNPLVTGQPKIRFYAGAPLFTPEGHGLGTLCVIDRVPRQLQPKQEKALLVLRTHLLKLLELRLKSRQLADINRELETYNYTISHDLHAPLRAIDGFSRILLEDHAGQFNQDARELVERIQNAANRMEQMTQDILYLSRIDRMELADKRIDLSKLAQDVMAELQKTDASRQADIVIQPDLVVFGDESLLRLLVENLLNNAWKFTSRRELTKIEFGGEFNGEKHEYFVRDNGAGFEMAYADKLFQPFQRLHSNAAYPGTGIGLATVKRIIDRHGGTIRAESYPDNGAIFRFTLPVY